MKLKPLTDSQQGIIDPLSLSNNLLKNLAACAAFGLNLWLVQVKRLESEIPRRQWAEFTPE